MKRTLIISAAVVLGAATARAQDPPAIDQQPRAQDARTAAAAPALTRDQLDHIFHIRQMEQTLTNAVKAGATSVAAELQFSQPASLFTMTDARTRGFDLDGYGVFFDVDVPAMMQSVVSNRQDLVDEYERLRQAISLSNNPEAKRIAAFEVHRIERALGIRPQPIPGIDDVAAQPPQGIAVATSTETTPPVSAAGMAFAAPPASPAVPPLPRDNRSPDEKYTDAIRNKVIDTILTFGGGLGIEDDQWLTVAARTTTAAPGQIDDSVSVFIRIKGADLTAFIQKKITREEVLKRIQIKEG